MTSVIPKLDKDPLSLPFSALLETLAAFDVPFSRKGDEIALKDPQRVLTGEIVGSVREHKADLLTLSDCRTELARLHDYLIKLRIEDPPKGTRSQAVSYQAAQIEKLAGRSVSLGGTAEGWYDPADVFAEGDQIEGLREGLAELTAEGNPYPVLLPEGCVLLPQANFDPFAQGRRYNGTLIKAAG